MRFAVSEHELENSGEPQENGALNASTSVDQLKRHYFDVLASLGQLIMYRSSDASGSLRELCAQDDVVLASFHDPPPEGTTCRLLQHSKGALMLPGGFLDGWTFRDATLNLLTSERQAEQLSHGLGDAAPLMAAFAPRLATDIFRLPTPQEKEASRLRHGVVPDVFHIVYAGRFIANKGIAQLVRALKTWPGGRLRITLVGGLEPDFFTYQSSSEHATFREFLAREVFGRDRAFEVRLLPPMDQQQLCELFWAADCFVYPSFHEDENFGMAPREALLCGVPAVVTDLCGLGALGATRGGVVETWPTLGGVRYRLHQLTEALAKVAVWCTDERGSNSGFNAEYVAEECDPGRSARALQTAAERLLSMPPGMPPAGGWRSKDRVDRWATVGPDSFKQAIALAATSYPDGLYVDGTGHPPHPWYSPPRFLSAIQGLYTTHPAPPRAQIGVPYVGFWRISLWPQERAVVEWGFPGPRVKRFSNMEWGHLYSDHLPLDSGEIIIRPTHAMTVAICDELITLGYLVPDIL